MFGIKEETKIVKVKKIQDTFTRSQINSLISAHCEKEESISVSKITWNKNGTATVEGKPTTAKKQKELEAAAAEKEGQK